LRILVLVSFTVNRYAEAAHDQNVPFARRRATLRRSARASLPELRIRVARRKLLLLHRAVSLQDLRVPPGNRLEELRGDRKGQLSIRINDQWRVCFVWRDGDAFDVEIADYHLGVTMTMVTTRLDPIHPGEILEEDFMRPLGLSANALANRI